MGLLEGEPEPLVAEHLLRQVLRIMANVPSNLEQFIRMVKLTEVQQEATEHLIEVKRRFRVHQVLCQVG